MLGGPQVFANKPRKRRRFSWRATSVEALEIRVLLSGTDGLEAAEASPDATQDEVGDLVGPQGTALQTAFDPCFDESRIPVEIQGWWTAFGHVHTLALLPVGQTVQGTLAFDVRVVMHDNPSRLQSIQVWDADERIVQVNVGQTFPAEGTYTINVPVSLDTTLFKDGWRQLSLRAVLKSPEGKRFATGSSVPVYVDNTDLPDVNNAKVTTTALIGNGFYDGFGYASAQWREIPTAKVSGQLNLRVKGVNEGDGRLIVALDADHGTPGAGPWSEVSATAGQVLLNTTENVQQWQWIRIDTTTLQNGWHSLAARGENNDADADGNRNAGVSKFWFFVEN
jgi:hypothetical protein